MSSVFREVIMEDTNVSLDNEYDGISHSPDHHSVSDVSEIPPVGEDDIPDGELNIKVLPSRSATGPNLEPIIPKGPGQCFALQPSVLNG